MERIINAEILADIQETKTFEDLTLDQRFINDLTKIVNKELRNGKQYVLFTDLFGLKVCPKSGYCGEPVERVFFSAIPKL